MQVSRLLAKLTPPLDFVCSSVVSPAQRCRSLCSDVVRVFLSRTRGTSYFASFLSHARTRSSFSLRVSSLALDYRGRGSCGACCRRRGYCSVAKYATVLAGRLQASVWLTVRGLFATAVYGKRTHTRTRLVTGSAF